MAEEIIELWKLVFHDSLDSSIRIFSAKKCKSIYKVIEGHHFIKVDSLLTPHRSLLADEYMSGYIYCLPEQYDEAAKLLEGYMMAKCEQRIQLLTKQLADMVEYKANPPRFTSSTKRYTIDY